jgi:hypothetical protein
MCVRAFQCCVGTGPATFGSSVQGTQPDVEKGSTIWQKICAQKRPGFRCGLQLPKHTHTYTDIILNYNDCIHCMHR